LVLIYMQRDAGTAKQAGAFIRGAYHELIAAWTSTFSVLRRHLNSMRVFSYTLSPASVWSFSLFSAGFPISGEVFY